MVRYEYIVLTTDRILWGPSDMPYPDRLQLGLNNLGGRGWSHTGTKDDRAFGGQELWTFRRRLNQLSNGWRPPPQGTIEAAGQATPSERTEEPC